MKLEIGERFREAKHSKLWEVADFHNSNSEEPRLISSKIWSQAMFSAREFRYELTGLILRDPTSNSWCQLRATVHICLLWRRIWLIWQITLKSKWMGLLKSKMSWESLKAIWVQFHARSASWTTLWFCWIRECSLSKTQIQLRIAKIRLKVRCIRLWRRIMG